MRFNVIGHVTSDIGLGVMACDLVRALEALGHEVAAFDVDPGLGRKGRSGAMDRFLRSESTIYRDGVDIAVFPVSAADHWCANYVFGRQRVAMPLWELPDINEDWLPALRRFDGVVSCSDFIYDALSPHLEVWRGQHPHYIDEHTPGQRSAYYLPSDKVVFTFSFDPSSDVQRKNPQAIVKAFLDADAPNALLCLQINRSAERFSELTRWARQLPADRIKVIQRHLTHSQAVDLIACSDVYISLHRSEGFGLGMHEAMLLGKPVIATNWSGNTSFMDEASACLVTAKLIEVNGTIPAYSAGALGKTTHWAEPSIDDATYWIRVLAENETMRRDIGAAALHQARQYQTQARRLGWLGQLQEPAPMLPGRWLS